MPRFTIGNLILMAGAIVAIVGWGARIESRTTPEAIGKIVQVAMAELELPVALPAGSVVAYMGKEAAPPSTSAQ